MRVGVLSNLAGLDQQVRGLYEVDLIASVGPARPPYNKQPRG